MIVFSSFTPRLNPNLVGHGAAERLLLDSVNGGRLAHAWLITGPRGIGKATLAFRFARFLLAGGAEGGGAGGLFGAAPPADSCTSIRTTRFSGGSPPPATPTW